MADKHAAADRIDFAAVTMHSTPGLEPAPGPRAKAMDPPFRLSLPKSGLSSSAALPSRQLDAQAGERLEEALAAARRLPLETLARLSSARIVEAAIGTLTAVPADTEVLAAAGAVILSRANQLPVSLEPLLRTHGVAALAAIEQARRAIELLSESVAATRSDSKPG